jgi:two-component system, NarL family, nitrate/nitrite response regulator NarL
MIRVAVVDDHPVARHGLTAILSAVPDIEVVAAMAGPAPVQRLAAAAIDVLICDPYPFGEPPWLEAVRDAAARVAVVVVSGSADPADALAAMQAGASGYLTKHASGDAFVTAIRSVVAGRVYLSAPFAEGLAAPPGRDRSVPPGRERTGAHSAPLSDREQEALAYIGRGFTHQQTARRMGVSKATVDTYVGRIRTKLRLGNKAELALAALRYVEPHHRNAAEAAVGRRPAVAA